MIQTAGRLGRCLKVIRRCAHRFVNLGLATTMQSLAFKSSVASTASLTAHHPLAVASRQTLLVEDRVRIRFSRFGRKKRPFYRIVAVDSRAPRETRVLEYLGWHDPLKKETSLNAPAIKKWISVGAQPSDTVGSILRKAMVIDTPPSTPSA